MRSYSRYLCPAQSVGNPDYGQTESQSEPKILSAPTLRGLVRKVRKYITEWNLGSGNWIDPCVFYSGNVKMPDGTLVGFVSYNGKLWERRPGFGVVNKEIAV